MAKGSGAKPSGKNTNEDRPNHKAWKKRPKVWDALKRRLTTKGS